MRGGIFEGCDEGGGGGAGMWKSNDNPSTPIPPPTLSPPTSSDEDHSQSDGQQAEYKEVVIVGNGPSAITLSYILAGNWPYYGDSVHPIEFLHHRLASNHSRSLLEQDLEVLCEGLEGRSSNPVSVLFDTLNHVDADLGVELPSFLRWIRRQGHDIDHVVLGRGPPGGAWQSMEQSALTLSLSHWMELPNLSYREWEQQRLRSRSLNMIGKQYRALVADVAQYYQEYVRVQQLEKYFHNHAVVTSVCRLELDESDLECDKKPRYWEVRGYSTWEQTPFCYVTPNVVLATGVCDRPNRLQVPGEDLPFVLHSLAQLEQLVTERKLGWHSDPVMIIGAGLTAADAIISARFYGVSVAHVFRRDVGDPDLIFKKLPENMYPEYHKVHQMMRGNGAEYRGYQSYAKHHILEILSGSKVRLEGPNASLVLKVSYVFVLIGSRPDLSFLDPDTRTRLGANPLLPIDSKQNAIVVDAFTYESVNEKGLFALGPLVGDNFVRFLQGGALAIASHLNRRRDNSNPENGERELYAEGLPPIDFGRSDVASFVDRVVVKDEPQSSTRRRWDCGWPRTDVDREESDTVGELSLDSTEDGVLRKWKLRLKKKPRRRRFSHPTCDKLDGV